MDHHNQPEFMDLDHGDPMEQDMEESYYGHYGYYDAYDAYADNAYEEAEVEAHLDDFLNDISKSREELLDAFLTNPNPPAL